MQSHVSVLCALMGIAAFIGTASAQETERSVAAVGPTGLEIKTERYFGQPTRGVEGRPSPAGFVADPLPAVRWTFDDAQSVPSSVALSIASQTAWVSQDLNAHRLQRFAIEGNGTPLTNIPSVTPSSNAADAAEDADLAVFAVETSTVTLYAYRSTSDVPLWDFTFPSNFTNISAKSLRVSRDGSVVCCAIRDDGPPEATRLYIFDGATGADMGTWDYPDRVAGIDLNDDGSLCLVTEWDTGRLIDTTTQMEVFTGSVTGGGGYGKISGNGQTIILGGFNVRIYRKLGGAYTLTTDFTAANQFFTSVALSGDGSTAAAMSVDYTNYLDTTTRVFDTATDTVLGQYDTSGTGSYQDSPYAAAISDYGSVVAVASWGTQNNDHPEVLFFDRDVNLIGSIDTPGSPYSIDLSGDGAFLVVGGKATHANDLGSGGNVTMYQVREPIDPASIPSFAMIADENTPVPDEVATFTGFGYPAIRDGDVVLYGSSREGSTALAIGIYTNVGGTLHTVVDHNTPVPEVGGNFWRITGFPSISNGVVAFTADRSDGYWGAYKGTSAGLVKLADSTMQMPGGTEDIAYFGSQVSIHNGDVAFGALTADLQGSVLAYVDDTLTVVADINTPIPGGAGNFENLYAEYFPMDNGRIAFRGSSPSESLFGIYTNLGGPLDIVADIATPMPGEPGNFAFVGLPHMRDGRFAFGGTDAFPNPTQSALFTSSAGVLTAVVDFDTDVPNGTGTFANLYEPCFDGRHIAFRGTDGDGNTNLYTNLTGSLTEVVAVGDQLFERTVEGITVGYECLDQNQIVFRANFTDGFSGVYVATFPPAEPGDMDSDGDVDLADYAGFADCLTGPVRRVPGDADGNGRVDADDFTAWVACLAGPTTTAEAGCRTMDWDDDNHVDLADYAVMQRQIGQLLGPFPIACDPADLNGDGVVDLLDFATLEQLIVP